jgi:hypothetical protein
VFCGGFQWEESGGAGVSVGGGQVGNEREKREKRERERESVVFMSRGVETNL